MPSENVSHDDKSVVKMVTGWREQSRVLAVRANTYDFREKCARVKPLVSAPFTFCRHSPRATGLFCLDNRIPAY